MIKITITALEGELSIEIKKNESRYDLIVIMSKSDYFKEQGRAWYGRTTEKQSIDEIIKLIKACNENPSLPKSITISDGIITKISFDEKLPIHLILKDIDAGTTESELMKKIFEFIHELIHDPVLEKYTYAFGCN